MFLEHMMSEFLCVGMLSYLALFHGLHDDLFQPGGLLLISGNPCEQHSVINELQSKH